MFTEKNDSQVQKSFHKMTSNEYFLVLIFFLQGGVGSGVSCNRIFLPISLTVGTEK